MLRAILDLRNRERLGFYRSERHRPQPFSNDKACGDCPAVPTIDVELFHAKKGAL